MAPRPLGPLLLPLRLSRGNTLLTGRLVSINNRSSSSNPGTTSGFHMAFNPPNNISMCHSTVTNPYPHLTKRVTCRPLWLP